MDQENKTMSLNTVAIILAVVATSALRSSHGATIIVKNNCPYTVWAATLGNPGHNPPMSTPERGGFQLNQGQSRTLNVERGWAGRVWGRTNCVGSGRDAQCETGHCFNGIECNGLSGQDPATLAEFTFDQGPNPIRDYYDVSLVDGFNLRMTISRNGCKTRDCQRDMNTDRTDPCPAELQVKRRSNRVVACKTDNKDRQGRFSAYAARVCPNTYGWSKDDTKTTSCNTGTPEKSSYTVQFC